MIHDIALENVRFTAIFSLGRRRQLQPVVNDSDNILSGKKKTPPPGKPEGRTVGAEIVM